MLPCALGTSNFVQRGDESLSLNEFVRSISRSRKVKVAKRGVLGTTWQDTRAVSRNVIL